MLIQSIEKKQVVFDTSFFKRSKRMAVVEHSCPSVLNRQDPQAADKRLPKIPNCLSFFNHRRKVAT
jgi:hypothetical protein